MKPMPATAGGATRAPNMRRLFLLRHGQAAVVATEGGVTDPWRAALTAQGKEQIAALADALAGCRLELLVTSAVPRALETAAILARRTGLRPVIEEGWNELQAGTVLTGSAEQVQQAVRDSYQEAARPGARFLGGELFDDFARRVEQALGRMLAKADWTRAAVVTHEPALRYVLARCEGLGLGGLGAFETATGSVSVFDCPPGVLTVDGARIRLANGTGSDALRLE